MAKPQPKPKRTVDPTTLHEDVHELFCGALGRRVLDGLRQRFHDKPERLLDLGPLAYAEGERAVYLLLERYATHPLEDLERDGFNPDDPE